MSEIKLKSIIKNFGGNSIAVDNLTETDKQFKKYVEDLTNKLTF